MKARFVYENINFERSKDPKEAIGIGIKNKIHREIKRLNDTDDNAEPFKCVVKVKKYLDDPQLLLTVHFFDRPWSKDFNNRLGRTYLDEADPVMQRKMVHRAKKIIGQDIPLELFEDPDVLGNNIRFPIKIENTYLFEEIINESIGFERGFKSDSREDILDRVLDRKITLELDAADVITDKNGKIDKSHEYNEFFMNNIIKSGAEWRQIGATNYGGVPIEFRGTKEQLLPIIGMWDAHQREPDELEAALKNWGGNETELWDIIG